MRAALYCITQSFSPGRRRDGNHYKYVIVAKEQCKADEAVRDTDKKDGRLKSTVLIHAKRDASQFRTTRAGLEMRGRPVFALVISVLMVVTGSLNTISAKWADRIEANGIPFNHPFLQAACMFIGELLCMVAFWVHFGFRKYMWKRRNKAGQLNSREQYEEPRLPRFNPFVFLPPAIADIIATSLMYIGLNLTTASSYQMLRGALIVCTGLLSIFLVNAHIQGYKWLGMLSVVLGLVVVGITDLFLGDHSEHKKEDVIIGDVLCVLAQAVVALQLVLEQKYLRKYDVEPLLAVGLEGEPHSFGKLAIKQCLTRLGIYGLTLLIIALVPLYFIHVTPTFSTNPEGRLEIAVERVASATAYAAI
ncbi:hypothetical protein NECAME_08866 [Necator americanus]|uniref:EamA domain-containing protein n=1 Tax=Necator americanus TaxID=51031 RepID=W2TH62_NECAM|nr:hypothetical protein NECAME_08866 [Necator americanus]ETN80934.1 hypothetical protein NECAME_08866 [Necator americanus]